MLFFIFFFKQKTAYEMRISDWSSDVCSSDLRRRSNPEPALGGWARRLWVASSLRSSQRRKGGEHKSSFTRPGMSRRRPAPCPHLVHRSRGRQDGSRPKPTTHEEAKCVRSRKIGRAHV